MSILWSPSYQQSVFKRCHSDRHLSELYLQDCGKNYNGTKLLHWHPMYSDVESLLHKFILFKFKWRDVADHAIQRCVRVNCQNIQAFEAFHRGLRPMLTATGFVNGRWQFLTTHRIHTPWPITKKFVVSDYIGDPLRLRKIWCKSAHGRGFWANGWNMTTFFILYRFTWTHLQVKHVDGFSRLMAQTTRTRARMWCAFWRFRWYCFPLWRWNTPQNPNFGGVNRCFQAKRTNIESFMLSKLLHRF